ncbi:MAG: ATP-dependent DNA helicase RecG [Candidatus Omnitrophica bacterium]|nr:ATP-dependent DNA helicase RecG [Candidatus Omnitrophota bacterium]
MDSIRYIKGIGPKKEVILNKLGIYSLNDILYYFPFRYEDRREIKRIKDLKVDEVSLIRVKVLAKNLKPLTPAYFNKMRNSIFQVIAEDNTGIVSCVWFNQGYLKDYIKIGDELFIYGKVQLYKNRFQIVSPEFEIINRRGEEENLDFGRIVSFYRLTSGINQKFMRRVIYNCLSFLGKDIVDPIPQYIRKEKKLFDIFESLKNIHFPDSFEKANLARQRFIFEELFFSQILVYMRKARHRFQKGIPFMVNEELIKRLEDSLPFKLTPSQEKVIDEIIKDLQKPYPMHRLLQGDVGSGKTVVACFAIVAVVSSGYQVAFMVPTEVLAFQHYQTLKYLFNDFSFHIEILTSSLKKSVREKILDGLKEGKIDIVLGTHSLIEEAVDFKSLGLVIIDEQHRFGVAQRALLPKKGKKGLPHCLVMSATPIPRSLALSLYGDLDLSLLTDLPPGRKKPETIVVEENKRDWVYDLVEEKVKEGRQCYIVYPIIEESPDLELKSLKEMIGPIKERFKDLNVEIFHGRLEAKEKERIIREFRENKINILVSTTVIEVGINIENATVMVVEGAQRFGLSQLHQLRGRVIRANYQPYFIIIKEKESNESAKKRLEIIASNYDGFKIAEEDLLLRGPGDFFGNLQWGFPKLKIANPLKDLDVLKQARLCAYQVIKKDPYLKDSSHLCIRKYLSFWLKKPVV